MLKWVSNVRLIYTFTCVSCVLLTVFWSHERGLMTQLGFGFGPYVESLNQAKYSIFYKDSTIPQGAEFFATRLPALPLIAYLLGKVFNDLLFLSILKNSLAAALTFYSVWRITKESSRWIQIGTPILVLFNFFLWRTTAPVPYEEGYVVGPFLFLVSCLVSEDERLAKLEPSIFGLLSTWIYLTKSSYFLVLIPLLILYSVKHRMSFLNWSVPLGCFVLAGCSWGFYVQSHTGRFAAFTNASSLNGSNLYKGNNPHFLQFYPYRNLDELHDLGYMDLPYKVSSEWEYNDGLMKASAEFRNTEPDKFKKGLIEKAKMVFLKLDGAKSNEPEKEARRIDKYFLFNRIIFWAWLAFSGALVFRKDRVRFESRLALIGLGSLLAISLPYILGFFYHRHLLPVFALATACLPLFAGKVFQRSEKMVQC
jgi:hypothetical protein